jgi:hypothetical protein
VVQAVLVYPQALQAHQFTMLVAVAVAVIHTLLEVQVAWVAVVKAVITGQVLAVHQDQEYMHKMAQLTLAVAEVAVIR